MDLAEWEAVRDLRPPPLVAVGEDVRRVEQLRMAPAAHRREQEKKRKKEEKRQRKLDDAKRQSEEAPAPTPEA